MANDAEFQNEVQEQFKQLPRVIQEAIVSADVSKRLRELADTHNLHLDQWEALENEVQYTLFGIQPTNKLAENIQKEVRVPAETAEKLAADISKIVFEPIRRELERQLDHPDAVQATQSAVDAVRTQILAENKPPTVAPATPPTPKPTQKVERAQISPTYTSTPSTARKTIEGDPYREQVA